MRIFEVYSHPQDSTSINFKKYQIDDPYNTAKSANGCRKTIKNIWSRPVRKSAKLYNLQILAFSINSINYNTTIIIISKNNISMKNRIKSTSYYLSARAGSLYRALRHFAENQINMLKIESRPIPDKPWNILYRF